MGEVANKTGMSTSGKRDGDGVLIVNANRCKTCIFNENQKVITEGRLIEIQTYLANGYSHTCHSTNLICRGSREYQATIFFRMRLIDEPTPEALILKLKDLMPKIANELFENPRDKYFGLNPNDVVFTPVKVARKILEMFKPEGACLEPCMSEGAFFDSMPAGTDWCEITKGRDFYDYHKKVDWIVTNPPYSDFDRFLTHAFELADNVVLLVPVAKVFKSWGTMQQIRKYGGDRFSMVYAGK